MTNMLDIELRLFCKTSVDKPTLQFRKQTHIGPHHALGQARIWSAWQDVPIEVAQDTTVTTGIENSVTQTLTQIVSDADLDDVFNSMPNGPQGFCRTWGYRDFARRLMALIAERLVK